MAACGQLYNPSQPRVSTQPRCTGGGDVLPPSSAGTGGRDPAAACSMPGICNPN